MSTQPNPDQPDRCPSIDPHDTLQCGRRIHEDDQCKFGGIAWRKGAPRYVSDSERLVAAEAECEYAEDHGTRDEDGAAWVEVAVIRAALHPDDA